MTNQSFDEFVSQQSEVSEEVEIDWAANLRDWKKHLSSFYEKVECFLGPYIKSKKIILSKKIVGLHEVYIGDYEVDALDILLGGTEVALAPIGTNLIGAKGRVDMKGPVGIVKFVLVPKGSSGPRRRIQVEEAPTKEEATPATDWEWKISTPPPRISYIELEEESFQAALMEVING